MGRPPCCDKVGIKKGPWTPEEDIILVSYIQEHGPGNWRSVPSNTVLLRCSKSCRLRWTNYLRPGIKRGNFTPHEEGMIIHLQALLGNKWAAIASYLPQRTDNDIKNYWNTHLKKKIKRYQSPVDHHIIGSNSTTNTQHMTTTTKSYDEKKNSGFTFTNQASLLRYSQTTTYASSTENISRLLEGWMKSSPKAKVQEEHDQDENSNNGDGLDYTNHMQCNLANKDEQESCDLISHEEFESLLTFDNISSMGWDKSSSDSTLNGPKIIHGPKINDGKSQSMSPEIKQRLEHQPLSSFLEKWLLEESGGHVEGMMELAV